jgi:hypothetical protein
VSDDERKKFLVGMVTDYNMEVGRIGMEKHSSPPFGCIVLHPHFCVMSTVHVRCNYK